jgi:hypothetical protein
VPTTYCSPYATGVSTGAGFHSVPLGLSSLNDAIFRDTRLDDASFFDLSVYGLSGPSFYGPSVSGPLGYLGSLTDWLLDDSGLAAPGFGDSTSSDFAFGRPVRDPSFATPSFLAPSAVAAMPAPETGHATDVNRRALSSVTDT